MTHRLVSRTVRLNGHDLHFVHAGDKRTHLIKLSHDDFDALFPGADPDAIASQWTACGVALVVLTRGAAGACGWTRSMRVQAAAQPVTVADSVGAGDSFQAALLARLAELDLLAPRQLRAMDADALQAVLRFAASRRAAALSAGCLRGVRDAALAQ